jgi:predicted DNA-binding antitoxin AbrB/MazE fold protein
MAQAARAAYEDGHLRMLDPINLAEREKVQLMILSEQERTHAALADLLVEPEPDTGDASDDAGLLAEIDATLQGQVPVSEAIIQRTAGRPLTHYFLDSSAFDPNAHP